MHGGVPHTQCVPFVSTCVPCVGTPSFFFSPHSSHLPFIFSKATLGKDVSHLVVYDDGALTKRTLKVIMAVARGVPVVGLEWIIRSHEAGRWLSPEPYVAWKPAEAPAQSLRGMKIFIGGVERLPKAHVCALIEAAGGAVVHSLGRASHAMGVQHADPAKVTPLDEAKLIELAMKPPSEAAAAVSAVSDELAEESEAESEEF